MIFDPSSASHLKPWLVRTLEPMYVLNLSNSVIYQLIHNRCDAEPGALADYILALLKHNVPEAEMRQELAVQLDEFLEKGQYVPLLL
jgi:RNA-binding protein 26